MPAGRPSKPTRIKELSGNPGKRKLNHFEPTATGSPVAPKTLSPQAAKVWRRLVASMPPGVYAVADEAILSAYAEAVALHVQATQALTTSPAVVPGSTGQLVASPWVRIQADQARLIASLGARLGLDPLARQALHQSDQQPTENKFTEFLN